MDTDTAGNHARYNQNNGMWKAYGLVYKLLQNGIPVHWAIAETKTSTTDVDFTVTSVKDKRTGTALGSWNYRGGPFIIDSAYAAQALPIINAWWAANGNQPNVHEAHGGLHRQRRRRRCAARRGSRTRRSTPASRPPTTTRRASPTRTAIRGRAPRRTSSTRRRSRTAASSTRARPARSAKYDIFVTPHNSGYSYSLTDPTNLGTRTYAQLDTFVHAGRRLDRALPLDPQQRERHRRADANG